MNSANHLNSPRRHLALLSQDGLTYFRWQDPKIIVWWAIAFPGFGHFLLHQFIRGFILSACEVGINTLAHINEAIAYSFSGRFSLAIDVVEPRWVFAYATMYLFSIWDSYVKAVESNKQYHLAKLENAKLVSNIIKPWSIAFMSISMGFILVWGPIIWGIIFDVIGFLLGYFITRLIQSKYFKHIIRKKERLPELAVIIECQEDRSHEVQRILWEYRALSVGRIKA